LLGGAPSPNRSGTKRLSFRKSKKVMGVAPSSTLIHCISGEDEAHKLQACIKPSSTKIDTLKRDEDEATAATLSNANTVSSFESLDVKDGGVSHHDNNKKSTAKKEQPSADPKEEFKKQNSLLEKWKKQSSRSFVEDAAKKSSERMDGPNREANSPTGAVKFWTAIEEFFFPKNRLLAIMNDNPTKPGPKKLRPGTVLLEGCETMEEHYAHIKQLCVAMSKLHGEEGLRAAGLEYQWMLCDEHKPVPLDDTEEDNMDDDKLFAMVRPLDERDGGDDDDSVVATHDDDTDEASVGALSLSALPAHLLPDGTPNLHLNEEDEPSNNSIRSTESVYTSTSIPISNNPLLTTADDGGKRNKNTNNSNGNINTTWGSSVAPNDLISQECGRFCHWCSRRLFYIPSLVCNPEKEEDTEEKKDQQSDASSSKSESGEAILIDEHNRKRFIADGDMYEQVARLSTEFAQEIMCQEANLQWVTIDEAPERSEPMRALVSSNHPMVQNHSNGDENDKNTPSSNTATVIICTGRGKVRAGIFSRQHMICSGLEMSTAIPDIREAVTRGMHVLVMDPNVHGETHGFTTFQKTLDHFYSSQQTGSLAPMYLLSHSASGGHFARYLLDPKPSCQHILSRMVAVAFTDSTHTIQWAAPPKPTKSKGNSKKSEVRPWEPHLQTLYHFLQSKNCVYFKCGARESRNGVMNASQDWYINYAGAVAPTDDFWKHRFGEIPTYWAGSNEHSLTNWYAHSKIWEHFDDRLAASSVTPTDKSSI